ncbi:AAA family ATPase [[Ruminococcus] torques]|uniref:AAA family ATPase n=1 Tax=[Ruminococcus] torques TaxID=33039 RepID=UPI002430D550|nr:AAA family ATPase [[Ruminococcus] torques]
MLQFTGLVIENFGPFKGIQTVDFVDADGVTIIWGNNGRGKTTLLNIIRYALFGKYQNRRGADVDLPSLANLEGKKDGKYDFKVVLKMLNDGVRYELTRQYIVRRGISNPQKNDDYEEHVFLKKEGAILSPDQREHELNLIMPNEVSRFFLFDGELLQEYEELLMEGTQTGTTIKESIEQILGVPVLTNGAIDTAAALEEYRKEKNKTAQSNAQTQKIAAQMTALEAEKQEHTAELSRLREEYNTELGNKIKLEDEAQQSEHVSTLLKSLDDLEADIESKNASKDAILTSIVLATGEAWKGLVSSRVDSILTEVNGQLKVLEDRESAHKVANHFMKEMQNAAMNHHCELCDQDIPDDKLEALVTRITLASSEFGGLTEDEAKTLQSLRVRKSTLQSMKADSKKEILQLLEAQLATLEVEIDDAIRQKRTVREELERHGNVEELSKDTKENVKQLANCLKKLDNLKDGIQQERDKIKEAESALATLEEKLNRVSTDSETQLAKRKVELCEEINAIFEEGIASYRDKLKDDVERDATELFVQISNDPDYTSLKINDNYGLYMVHSSGEIVPLRSAGFEHVVALALIGALHKNAPLRGPIIMDSPFGRLDPTHKSNITKVLPKMSEQIVLLAYTHEIDEQTARDTLGTVLKREYRLQRYSSFNTQIEMQ